MTDRHDDHDDHDDQDDAVDPREPVTDLTDEHDRLRTDLGGYVLGNLTVAEQQAVEVHLETCAACRDELVELESIPVMLDLARPAPTADVTEVTGAEPLARHQPAAAAARPTATPVRARAWSRRRRALAGAAGVLAVAAALVVGVLIGRTDEPGFGPSIALRPVAPATQSTDLLAPSGTAALRATDHGTAVRLDLEGLPTEGTWYECTWSSGQGEQSAGTFRPDVDGSVHLDLTTAARLYPGWTLTIVEHRKDSPEAGPVLEASA